ncbi:sensor histidine kinase [Actinomycetospora termitidis]|uniref:histidine kinase n=1 Tax=Actinomycetospora termitidis TaxID=3053470 RepID=A0ABT7MCS8_9PSEU|nr:sensor histidine kinase [Actinomycetospora sp. Odt1-22]MDL5158479.1 sensor histidine kinase [Actinomycetospora sp. Odt1-22]
MHPALTRLGVGLVAGAVVVLGSAAEAGVYRGVDIAFYLVPVLTLATGALLAPLLPWVGLLAAAATFPLQALAAPDHPGVGGIALITMMVLVAYGARRLPLQVSGPGAAVVAVGGATGSMLTGAPWFELVFFGATMGGAWSLGWLLRRESRRSTELARLADELAAERERSTRLALVEERSRISRELHDAVAHSVSVMTLQVGVVRRRLERADAEAPEVTALRAVEDLGRRSVDELRRVVGVLREDRDDEVLVPAPSLRQLDDLVERLAGAGLAVHVRVTGEPGTLPPAVDTSAHRIVAEALTNVLRHAGTDRAEVGVHWEGGHVTVDVLDDGVGGEPAGTGHGLVHLRERALMAGGTLEAGPRPDGGFRVRVVLPVPASEPVAVP